MKAAILRENNDFLKVEEVDIPIEKENEALIKIMACGVCHTDLHYIDHGVRTFKNKPIILGHEASGIVERVGKNVANIREGDKVIIPSVLNCGKCEFCLNNRENLCVNMIMPGNHINGCYAEFCAVPAEKVVKLPENISFEEGALIADAVTTAYHAVYNRSIITKESTAVVIGCGGIGLSLLQMLKTKEANIIALDINNEKLDYAKDFGAQTVINIQQTEFKNLLKQLPKKIDYIYEAVGSPEASSLAIKIAKPSSNICIVGYNSVKTPLNLSKIMFYELNVFGSLGCKISSYPDVFDLIEKKLINVSSLIAKKYSLTDINLALDDLRFSRGIRPVIIFNNR